MILGLVIILLALIFVGLFIAFVVTLTKAHRLVVRNPTNKQQYVWEYLCIEKKNKDTKSKEWVSVPWQPKFKCEKPPAEAINVMKKGRMHAECYLVAEGQFCWITDEGINIQKRKKEDNTYEWAVVDPHQKGEDGFPKKIDTFRPFNITQRQSLINQHRYAEEISKNKGWTAERITTLSVVGVLGMVIIVALIMGGEFWNGLNQAQSETLKFQQEQSKMLDKLAIIAQAIGTNIDGLEASVAQTPKGQSGSVIQTDDESPPMKEDG